MKKNLTLEEKAVKLNKIKNIHIFETAFAFIGTCSLVTVPTDNDVVLLPIAILGITIFYHGLSSYDRVKEGLIDLHQKIMLKDMEN